MPVTKIPALGWQNCARLSNDHAELLVTLDVGPRILSYKVTGGENVLRTFPAQLGKSGEPGFQVRGGHRIWAAPEGELTNVPDNGPVALELIEPAGVRAATPANGPANIRREMTVSLAADSPATMIEHRLTNEGTKPMTVASWGLTIMATGGWEIIPQPPLGVHGRELLPNRVIVPWTYTDLSDDRWRIGRRFWLLHPKAERPSAKLGFSHRERWVAHVLPKALFIKTFDYEEGAAYPDLGCNYETFTKGDFIELETLSPLRQIAPGESVSHTETWHLFGDIVPPDGLDEAALEKWITPFLAKIGLL
jgi:hypothetical protein